MSETNVVDFSDVKVTDKAKALNQDAARMLIVCQEQEIKNNDQYKSAAEILKDIKGKMKDLEAERKSMTGPLDEAKKRIMDFFRKPLEWLEEGEKYVKAAMLTFQQEQERIRQEQERKLQEEARKKEEAEKAKLLARAQKAEEKGKDDKAEDLRAQAEQVSVPAPILPDRVEKIEGVKTMTIWKFRIVDENAIPREYLLVNEIAIGKVVRATKGAIKIPGIEIFSEETIASGRA